MGSYHHCCVLIAKLNRHLILCTLLFVSLQAFAQNINYINYTTNNSKLPHDIVYRLKQDHNGFIWICTDDGLVRFDGREMKSYETGFTSKYAIVTDEENNKIW